MRNIQRAVSGGKQIMGQPQSEVGDSQGQQILIMEGERGASGRRCLPALLLQTSSDPETLAKKYMASPRKLQRTSQLLSEGITQNPINYASCPQVTPGSHLPDSLL